jgi:hypothetical protein
VYVVSLKLLSSCRYLLNLFSVGPSFGCGGFHCHKLAHHSQVCLRSTDRLDLFRWIARAVERYSGPWNSTPAHPILVIGNKADPITSFASAKHVADLHGSGAVLVEQDDYGVRSLF